MPSSIAEQERQAIELFARAERRVPVTHSVVRLPPIPLNYPKDTTLLSRRIPFRVCVLMRVCLLRREGMHCSARLNFLVLPIHPSND